MATNSKIEWTEATWNPVAGCSILSPGCTNCYAMRLAARLAVMGQEKYAGTTRKTGGRHKWNGVVKIDPSSLDAPRRWKKGRLIFANSMSDLFHESVPLVFIKKVFQVMEETPQHTYQVLTKRAERLEELSKKLSLADECLDGRLCRELRLPIPYRPPAPDDEQRRNSSAWSRCSVRWTSSTCAVSIGQLPVVRAVLALVLCLRIGCVLFATNVSTPM